MKINIETIPHKQQRYPTVGDWYDEDGALQIKVSEMGNPDYEFLVALHELVEVWLCKKRGISQKAVDDFDMEFEKKREKSLVSVTSEPGEEPDAPYQNEHLVACGVELTVAAALGVKLAEYDTAVNSL
jgi:hypothetical protein